MTIFTIAIRNLLRKPARTVLLASIVSVCAGALFGTTLVLSSASGALRAGVDRLGADILVVPERAELKFTSALLAGEPAHFLMERSVLDRVRTIEGVRAASPQLFLKPSALSCCYDVDVFLVGYDPATDLTVGPWIARNLPHPPGRDEVVAGSELPVGPGDAIPFFGTVFRINGVLAPTGMDFFDRAVFLSLDDAYRMAEASRTRARQPIDVPRDRISAVLVQAGDGNAERVAIRIEHAVPGVKALVASTVIGTVRKQLTGLSRAGMLLGAAFWAVVLLVMALAFSLIIQERRREIGVLRATGAARGQIARLLLFEAGALASCGGAAGTAAAASLLFLFRGFLLEHVGLPSLLPPPASLAVTAFAAVALSALTGMAAALLPLRTILRQEPYDAIRREE